MAKHTNAWKTTERIHAINHNAPGRTGPQGKDLPDWVSKVEAGESKLMTGDLPKWIREAIEQSVRNCEHWLTLNPTVDALERLPIVVLHEAKTPYTEDVVMVNHAFWLAWVLPALEAYWKEHPEAVVRVRNGKR